MCSRNRFIQHFGKTTDMRMTFFKLFSTIRCWQNERLVFSIFWNTCYQYVDFCWFNPLRNVNWWRIWEIFFLSNAKIWFFFIRFDGEWKTRLSHFSPESKVRVESQVDFLVNNYAPHSKFHGTHHMTNVKIGTTIYNNEIDMN